MQMAVHLALHQLAGADFPIVMRADGIMGWLSGPEEILRTVEPRAEDPDVLEIIGVAPGLVVYHSKFAESFDPLNTVLTFLLGKSIYGTAVIYSR